jgi:hypothetical protein
METSESFGPSARNSGAFLYYGSTFFRVVSRLRSQDRDQFGLMCPQLGEQFGRRLAISFDD